MNGVKDAFPCTIRELKKRKKKERESDRAW